MGTTTYHNTQFNEKGEAMCGADRCNARARTVAIITVEGGRAGRLIIPHLMVSDDVAVGLGIAKCGRHNRGEWGDRLPAQNLTGNLDDDLKMAVAHYEEMERQRKAREEMHRASERRRLIAIAKMTEDDFKVERDEEGWLVSGPDYGNEWTPIHRVYLDKDDGVARVGVNDYIGHVGRGRGSPALARIVAGLILEAAARAEEYNKEVEE